MLKRFEFDNDGCIDHTPIGDCVDYEEANELLLEAYQAIEDNCIQESYQQIDYCIYCEKVQGSKEDHDKDCIVLKAQEYIREVAK